MAINRYDYASTGNDLARLILGTTVDLKKQRNELDQRLQVARMQSGVELQKAQIAQDTSMEVAKLNSYVNNNIAKLRADTDVILKSMGIDNDRILAAINNLAAKERVELQNEMNKLITLLKNQNVLDAIEETFQRKVKELNVSSDEEMKRLLAKSLFDILKSSQLTPLSDLVKTGEFVVLLKLFEQLYPGIEKWNDENFGNIGGKVNEPEREQEGFNKTDEKSKSKGQDTYETMERWEGTGGEGKYRPRWKKKSKGDKGNSSFRRH